MAEQRKKKGTSAVFWVILGFIVLGLGGFGVTNFTSNIRAIGRVGDREIPVTDYASALNQEIKALTAQVGTNVSFEQAEQLGVVASVRGQVISSAALDGETARLGLSVGDQAVQQQVLAIPAFKGLDGKFDRAAYADSLRQNGLTEPQFETKLRDEAARGLLQATVLGGFKAPAPQVEAILSYELEQRRFDYTKLDETLLTSPVPDPTEEAVKAEYDAHPEAYTTPETREITYVWLTPEMLLDKVQVDDAALRSAYDARAAEFIQPERRLVERLVFPTQEEAAAAKARIDSGEIEFNALVQERGLELADVDIGEVTKAELGAAGDAVFALAEPGVVGPAQSDLGPALFRMNGILEAQETSFEDAREALSTDIAMDGARRMVLEAVSGLNDRLAEGATLEDLDKESDMQLGTIAYSVGVTEGIAAYDEFRAAAEKVTKEDFAELVEMEDGGVFALRLDALQAPAVRPLDEVKDAVIVNWRKAATAKALLARGDEIGKALSATDAADIPGVTLTKATPVNRRGFIEGVPKDLLEAAFTLEGSGSHKVLEAEDAVWLVILREVIAVDLADEETKSIRTRLEAQMEQNLANDALSLFTGAIETDAGIHIDEAAVNAVHAQFR